MLVIAYCKSDWQLHLCKGAMCCSNADVAPPPLSPPLREHLEIRKIQGLTFRLMPEAILIRTLSFGSEEDEWLNVCKDWLEALSPSSSGEELAPSHD